MIKNLILKRLFFFLSFFYLALSMVQLKLPVSIDIQSYYVALLLMFLVGSIKFPAAMKVLIKDKILFTLIVVLFLSFLWGLVNFGFRIDNIRVFILFFSLMSGIYFYQIVGYKKFINKVIPAVSFFILLILIARIFIYPNDFIALMVSNRFSLSDSYPFLMAGGHNIEPSMLLVFSVLIRNRFLFFSMFCFGVFYSLLYESRAGMLLGLFIILFRFGLLNLSVQRLFISLVVFLFLLIVSLNLSVVDRFLDFEREIYYGEIGVGRLGFYYGALNMLNNGDFGVGIANAVYTMSLVTGVDYAENNVHNIFLQYFLDSGPIAAFLLIVLAVRLALNAARMDQEFLPGAVVFAYFLIGLIQFTGYDSFFWFFIGFFTAHLYSIHERLRLNKNES